MKKQDKRPLGRFSVPRPPDNYRLVKTPYDFQAIVDMVGGALGAAEANLQIGDPNKVVESELNKAIKYLNSLEAILRDSREAYEGEDPQHPTTWKEKEMCYRDAHGNKVRFFHIVEDRF